MRIRMVSALCVLLPLIYSPRPAAAQFNPSLPPIPQAFARKLPSPAKLSELQTGGNSGGVATDAELMSKLRSLVQQRGAKRRQETNPMEILSLGEGNKCAHIDIIQARDVDAKMIKEVPKDFASNMPMWQGLQSCFRDFLGITVIPRAAPLVNPGQIWNWPLKPRTPFLVPKP
jgi:hypothetical protein